MDEPTRRRIIEYVKPLAVGLDGTTSSGDIDRILVASERIAKEVPGTDRDLLFLLAVFSGQDRWVQRMGHGSRTEIFLSSLGLPDAAVAALFRGLPRIRSRPATREEEVVHDALALEEMGAHGIVRQLLEGYRERRDLPEMAEAIERAAGRVLLTSAGETLAEPRRRAMREFVRHAREEHEEFRGPASRG